MSFNNSVKKFIRHILDKYDVIGRYDVMFKIQTAFLLNQLQLYQTYHRFLDKTP